MTHEYVKNDLGKFTESKFNTCDTCVNGRVTVRGVECGTRQALSCKPYLLEKPKHYLNWESVEG